MKKVYFDLDLPSAGRLYKTEGVKIRQLVAGDEKFLQDLSAMDFDVRMNLLLKNGVLQGIEPEELSIGDRMYIIIWLARNCLSDMVPLQDVCQHCLTPISREVSLGELEIVKLPEAFKEPVSLKLSESTVKVRLLRVKDLLATAKRAKQGRDDLDVFKMSRTVCSEDGSDMLEAVSSVSLLDLGKIKAAQVKFFHGVKFEIKVVCETCGGEGILPVPFRLEYLVSDVVKLADDLDCSF